MNYYSFSDFEWNARKSDQCLKERGFDFEYVTRIFDDRKSILRPDTRFEYGENRYQIVGMIAHRVFVVVFTVRVFRIRIISARKANQRERNMYENYQIFH